MHPLLILVLGIVIVIGMILVLRVNAFIAMITTAMIVSLLAPGEWSQKISRVATEFGATAGKIGIVIAMAAIIGDCMTRSGAADRVVRAFMRLLGVERGAVALMSSGFVLSIPVFFDTVFYLLIPLARSMHRQTKQRYLFIILAMGAGASITHSLVPPTPGPLFIAEKMGIDMGLMILMGLAVAIPDSDHYVLFREMVFAAIRHSHAAAGGRCARAGAAGGFAVAGIVFVGAADHPAGVPDFRPDDRRRNGGQGGRNGGDEDDRVDCLAGRREESGDAGVGGGGDGGVLEDSEGQRWCRCRRWWRPR